MFAIGLFGAVMIAISLFMVAKPGLWGDLAVRFARLRFMHPLEIFLRIAFGALFLYYAERSDFPITFTFIGYALVAVGIGLLFTPPSIHRRVAVWAIEKTAKYFRPAGLVSLAFGVFLVYAAL